MATRRKFLKTSGAIAAGAAFPPLVIASTPNGHVPPSDKVRVALVGCRGMGAYDMRDHLKFPEVECAGLCDIDENVLNERSAEVEKLTGKKPSLFKDYRRVLDDKSIHAVIIATPDHWHCLMTAHACESGKDVYVEKPLANSIGESEVMLRFAKKYNRVVQVGQQQRSGQHWQDVVAKVKSGALGKIRRIKTWGYFEYGKANPKVADSPVPSGVDYDAWLGPSPKRAFNANRFHGTWRFFWEHGGGLMTDWGVHLLDIPLWVMNVSIPKSVSSYGGIYAYPNNAIETADTQSVIYDYGDFILEWEHAGGITRGLYGRNYGIAFIGNLGTLVVNREGWEVIPEMDSGTPRMEAIPFQASVKTDHERHVRNFIDCMKSRQAPICDIEFGRNASVVAHLGNIAYRTGDKLVWDEAKQSFGKDARANALIKPDYRAPWKFPQV